MTELRSLTNREVIQLYNAYNQNLERLLSLTYKYRLENVLSRKEMLKVTKDYEHITELYIQYEDMKKSMGIKALDNPSFLLIKEEMYTYVRNNLPISIDELSTRFYKIRLKGKK